MLTTLNPLSIDDLLKAHKYMMQGLINENGKFRSSGICITNGDEIIHIAPPAELVPSLISDLFRWYKESKLHVLIKSAIFHYEFEFIHPFADGNSRIGRMWHSMLLGTWREVFYWLPVEDIILSRQKEYYDALSAADKKENSADFTKLMLEMTRDAVKELGSEQATESKADISESVLKLLNAIGQETLSASEIMSKLGLSHKPSFRKNYLVPAINQSLIEMTIPDKPNSRNQKYRLSTD